MQQFILRKLITSALLIMAISSNALFAMKSTQEIIFDFGNGSLQFFNSLQDVGYTIINSMSDEAVIFGQTNKKNNAAVNALGRNNLLNLNNDPHHNLNFICNNYVPIMPININRYHEDLFFNYFKEQNRPDITNQQYLLAISPCRKNFYTNLNDEQKNDADLWKNLNTYEQETVLKFIERKKTLNTDLVKLNKAPVLKISSYDHHFENGQPLTNQLFLCKNKNEINNVLNKWQYLNSPNFKLEGDPYWVFKVTLFTLIQYPCYNNNAFEFLLNKAKNVFTYQPKNKLFNKNKATLMFDLLFYAKKVNNLNACYQLITIDPFNTVANPLNFRFDFHSRIGNTKQILDLLIENNFDQEIIKHFRKCGGKTAQELEDTNQQSKKKNKKCIIS
jgi:hypothetical protein